MLTRKIASIQAYVRSINVRNAFVENCYEQDIWGMSLHEYTKPRPSLTVSKGHLNELPVDSLGYTFIEIYCE